MYLFILESIGTSELFLIGIVALIVFGPRKLPQMAKTLGKFMAEFRSTTNEFKSTWQKEAAFEDEKTEMKDLLGDIKKIGYEDDGKKELNEPIVPEIRQIDASEIKKKFELGENIQPVVAEERIKTDKRDWL